MDTGWKYLPHSRQQRHRPHSDPTVGKKTSSRVGCKMLQIVQNGGKNAFQSTLTTKIFKATGITCFHLLLFFSPSVTAAAHHMIPQPQVRAAAVLEHNGLKSSLFSPSNYSEVCETAALAKTALSMMAAWTRMTHSLVRRWSHYWWPVYELSDRFSLHEQSKRQNIAAEICILLRDDYS